MSIPPFVDYHSLLIEDLRNPQEAAAYLNAALEDGHIELLMMAIQNVAEAQGGLDKLAGKIHFFAA
ncbi:MAG: hypothetical protein AB1656_21525 [Candidatus Omnitrophota bacterium]